VFDFIQEYWTVISQNLGWSDLFDIAVVAFLIFQLLQLMRGTRAIQTLSGLAILFIFYWLSDRFELLTLRAVLGSVFDNWILILILLFHQDIRRALSQFGRASFISTSNKSQQSQIIEEIIRSCVSLAGKKIGALIVIEREADIGEFVEAGVELDCVLSKEAITSFFLPVSPLHDGALLVRNGRIALAGCFLPLSLNPLVSKALGTRHRAALGITEETDSLCIVVSEEKGTISVAASGKITHDLDAAQLRRMLTEML